MNDISISIQRDGDSQALVDGERIEFKSAQWTGELSESGFKFSNQMEAKTGPKAGQIVEAFFVAETSPDKAYGAMAITQESDFDYPVKVRIPQLKDGAFDFAADGNLVTAEAEKRVVGGMIVNANNQITDRFSWSNLAIFSGKEWDFNPETLVLTIEDQHYRMVEGREADKNRLDGIAGVFRPIDSSEKDTLPTEVPISIELADTALLVVPQNAAINEALIAARNSA